jgi:hypothetical protein
LPRQTFGVVDMTVDATAERMRRSVEQSAFRAAEVVACGIYSEREAKREFIGQVYLASVHAGVGADDVDDVMDWADRRFRRALDEHQAVHADGLTAQAGGQTIPRRDPTMPTGPEATPQRRIAWISGQIRAYARLLAFDELLGECDPGANRDENFAAASGFGAMIEAGETEIAIAANREWHDATQRGANCLEHLRRRVWPMAAARMPEDSIIQAAKTVLRTHDEHMGDEVLMPFLRNVWSAATRRGPRR